MQALPIGKSGCSVVDKVFRDVKVKELGGLRVNGCSTGMEAEVTHSLLHLIAILPPSLPITSSHSVRYGGKGRMSQV